MPVYVKDNSLLPLAAPVEHIAPETCFNLTVNVYGDKPAPFTLYDDDGVSYDFEQGAQTTRSCLIGTDRPASRKRPALIRALPAIRVSAWKPLATP